MSEKRLRQPAREQPTLRQARPRPKVERDEPPILELQRQAGNAAIADLISGRSPGVQRESISHTLTEFGKDTWNLVRPEKEEEKEKEPDLIKDTLEKANERIEQVKNGLLAASVIAQKDEVAEQLEKAHEGMEKYGGFVEKGLKGYKVYKLVRAAQALEKADLLKDPDQATEAFDTFFTTFGDLGEDLCDSQPEFAVAKPYFTFLKSIDKFFENWNQAFKKYTQYLNDTADGKMVARPELFPPAKTEERAEDKPVKFDAIGEDLKHKAEEYDKVHGEDSVEAKILADRLNDFMATYNQLLGLWKQRRDLGLFGIKITGEQREESSKLLDQMAPLQQEALDRLQALAPAIAVETDITALNTYYR